MGSRKRRRERDSSRRHRKSQSRSSSGSRSRTRSRSPIAPPPPSISSQKSNREKDEKEDRHRHRHKESKRKHHHRDKSRSRSPTRSRRSKPEAEIHSDSKILPYFHANDMAKTDEKFPFLGSDCVEVPIPPPAPVISKRAKSKSPIPENGAGDSLSISETNKLRAKLGLKPLEVNSSESAPSSSSKKKTNDEGHQMHKDEWGEFYHKPANNIAEKLQAEKLREKFRQRKEKRELEKKLKAVKTLGESDEDDDISKWVSSSRDKEKLKAEAARRAKILEEMDDEFGVGELVQEETRREKKKIYSEHNLKGLKVDHDMDAFTEGKSVILTLKDQGVLDEDDDTLVNVNMVDDERYRKNIENKKLNPNQYGYNVFQDEVDEFGNPLERNVLGKYDEEIDGTKKKTFNIGHDVEAEIAQKRRLQEVGLFGF